MDVLLTIATVVGHPLVQGIQIQASLVLVVGIIGWFVAGIRKGREAQRLTAAGYTAALQQISTGRLATAATGAAWTLTERGSADIASDCLAAKSLSHVKSANTSMNDSIAVAANAATHMQGGVRFITTYHGKDHEEAGMAVQMSGRGPDEHQQQQYRCDHLLSATSIQQQQGSNAKLGETAAATPQTAASATHNAVFKSVTGRQAGVLTGWPPVAVVCPVKGCRPHSRQNWQTQLAAHYGGPRIFIFAVESEDDAAVAALREMMLPQQQQLQQQYKHSSAACSQVAAVAQLWQQAQIDKNKQRTRDSQQQQIPPQQVSSTTCILDVWQQGTDQLVMLVDAGLATTCSQKIHNILAGIEVALSVLPEKQQRQQQAAQSPACDVTPRTAAGGHSGGIHSSEGYIFILDDDVSLHPLSLMQLVDELDADQSLFMVTGYPHDIVTAPTHKPGSSSSSFCGRLWSYAAAAYHLPLCIGFSVADRGGFVWGGVMVLRAPYLQAAAAEEGDKEGPASQPCSAVGVASQLPVANRSNILQVWRDGGYSDDLLLSGFCAAHKLSIGLPVSAYFPQLLPATCTFTQYWNYLRRQLFVLDTYYSQHNKGLNHTMMVLHSYGSILFTGATLATAVQLLLLMLALVVSTVTFVRSAVSGQQCPAGAALNELTAASSITSSNQCVLDGSQGRFALPIKLVTTGFEMFVFCTVLSLISISYMNSQVRRLFRVLSPEACHEVLNCDVSVIMLWCGWTVENMILPYCTLYCYLCDHIVWGGITYHKKDGRIYKIVHPKQ